MLLYLQQIHLQLETTFNITSSITLPSGTTAQRDGSPAVGMIRHNSQTNQFEGYNNGAWGSLSGASGISNVVDDTSPQLGGNLDVQAREINTSTTNGNIKVTPNGTGLFEIKGATNDGTLQLNCNQNSHGVKIKSPAHSAGQSYTLILPDNQIAADKVLKVKSISGSGATAVGQLEYADAGGGGGTGGGGEQIFFESSENAMDNNYTISSNHNALVAGPLTINATLTINSPSVVTIP